jgi:hypothetical protein
LTPQAYRLAIGFPALTTKPFPADTSERTLGLQREGKNAGKVLQAGGDEDKSA